jgi:signal transduction histidine kinase
MIISDDGIGFDLLALKTESGRKSWGLLNIRERAEAIGGDIQIETQPGQGTRVMVDVPL